MVARFARGAWLCACLLASTASAEASAQHSRLMARASLDAATMLSRDQLGRLAYDRVGLFGGAHLAHATLPRLDLQLGVLGGGFLSSSRASGGLVAATLGSRFHALTRGLAPWASAEFGPGMTGRLIRPFFRMGLGLDIPLGRAFTWGPAVGYGHLVQTNGPGHSSDARYVWVGLTLMYRPAASPVPAPPLSERKVIVEYRRDPPEPVETTESRELITLLDQALPSPVSKVELLAPVLFAFDSDQLEPVGVAMLHEVARELKARPDIRLVAIQGYADRRGQDEYNRALSQRRAERVLEWLVSHEVERERLVLAAEGATGFVESGVSEPEHQQNRRVVFRVLLTDSP